MGGLRRKVHSQGNEGVGLARDPSSHGIRTAAQDQSRVVQAPTAVDGRNCSQVSFACASSVLE